MKTVHEVRIEVDRDRVWPVIADPAVAARHVPGARDVRATATGCVGTIVVQVGPIRLNLAGEVERLASDVARGRATYRLRAADPRVGGAVSAQVDLELEGSSPTTLRVLGDITLLGRIGELGQPLIRRRTDQLLAEFAESVARELRA
jgi:carbon monoxide dehydrogenase subunit G